MADQSVHTVQMLSANHTVQWVQRFAHKCFELGVHVREHPPPRIQSHSTADTAVNRTLLKTLESHLHLREHFREQDCSHLTLILYYLPFHSVLWQHCLLCSAIRCHPAACPGFVSVLFSNPLLDWKLFGTSIQLPNTQTLKQIALTTLKIPKSSRSQIIILKNTMILKLKWYIQD